MHVEVEQYDMWLEIKYVNLLSSSLPLFKSKGNNVWNFRCPICNDSKKSKHIARGYILESNGKYNSYCHNCHLSLPLGKFIERINPVLYSQYLEEKFESGHFGSKRYDQQPEIITMKKVTESKALLALQRVSLLDQDHIARQYVIDRKLPYKYHSKLYYTDNFNKFANRFRPDRYDPELPEKRLVIPMLDRNSKLIGFQGRAIDPSPVKYITVLLASDNPKLFGLDTVNLNRTYYAFEGPIDSMFVQNSIASCGGRIDSEIIKNSLPKDLAVIVYDNEPRNKDIVTNMKKAIEAGFKIVIWPKHILQTDINDMILAGHSIEKIMITIQQNVYHSLEATSKLQEWKK